ncbi:hypothetical protein HHK36_023827 [Tetracentron sinense]|uniref:Aminotransferase-like plant mobile domain-containing protein n=1 Tax=Tetracentron sinense TaxID=13715 RepID=A0A834YT52_TETSI|nr:hypothetical protein HHK36_023827 [Tetracentron sinense]
MAEEETIVEEREEKMASPLGGNPTVRIARFLRPCANHVDQVAAVSPFPLLAETISHGHKIRPSDVLFKGWKNPQKKWREWLTQMSGKYKPIWIKTGIFHAIMNSVYEIRTTHSLVLGLLEVWCPETNTFVLPWGEATLTLEDMLILGGFSVLGEPITSPLTRELVKIEEEIIKEHKGFNNQRARKANHSSWLNHFMGYGSELEHVAFLALWLSR